MFQIVAWSSVSVVIPTRNKKGTLLECLNALVKSSCEKTEIIVVDNASTDSTFDAVKKLFPSIRLVRNERNLGASGGRNIGAAIATGDHIFFLDHDVIVERHTVRQILEVLDSVPSVGIAGPVIYYENEPSRIWAAGTSINMLTGKVHFNADLPLTSDPFQVSVLPAAFMLKKEVLDRIGLFDEDFFATYEDTDLCFRVRKAGYAVVCVPEARAWHKVSYEPGRQSVAVLQRSYYVARNRIIFMKKHARLPNFFLFLALFMPVFAAYYVWQSQRHQKFHFAKEYWRGLVDGLRKTL